MGRHHNRHKSHRVFAVRHRVMTHIANKPKVHQSRIKHFFSSVYHSITSAPHRIIHSVHSAITHIASSAKNTINHVISSSSKVINHVVASGNKFINNVVHTAGNVVNKGIDLVKYTENRITSTISTPLIIIAGGLAAFLILGRKEIAGVANTAIRRV